MQIMTLRYLLLRAVSTSGKSSLQTLATVSVAD